ncbi:alpha/beta fold hydrolase [Paractinoplanes rishiriensis]|uniref:alpha/beta fold hydrolase n=1 Tax=Paractinoplanes rishiriensis TaxID=1050105 RepID=UPI001EF1C733|nr:alpha/beta hydrolase [Actinoplanes rishiriensis]
MVAETMVPVNGIELCVETFGEPTDPALLLIAGGASSMDWWEDEFCRRLAAGGRCVIRYDHRDTGRSTSFPAGCPPYSGVDLAHDALGVLDALGVHRAHLVGMAMGGALAQRIAVERPHRVRSLTLMSAVPGETPAHPAPAVTDWSHRRASVRRMIAAIRERGGPFTADEPHLRRLAERIYDRTTDMAASQANHHCLAHGPPVRPRLGSITAPTLVLHGTLDRVVPAADAHALAAEIPGARLVWLDGVGHEFPPMAVWAQVIDEISGEASRGRQPA